jgi:hypothetical protein
MSYDGKCHCDPFWEGDHCQNYVYTGRCHGSCSADGCVGPNGNDCITCTHNAFFNENQECECLFNWEGTDCSVKRYKGGCNSICDPYFECTGPTPADCYSCVFNAEFNYDT